MDQYLSSNSVQLLIDQIQTTEYSYTYERQTHRLVISGEGDSEKVWLRLPFTFGKDGGMSLDPVSYLIILIQSGSCALGYFEDDQVIEHKVFKSYMVRKKQGKSQVKYLKTKGKSRAGSRVRLSNTTQFFNDINERLQDYLNDYVVDRIALSCSKTLLPYLFQAKTPCPFDKDDERIIKIPKHIHTPGLDILMDTQDWLLHGQLTWEEAGKELAEELLQSVTITHRP